MKQLRQILLSVLVATLLAGAIPYQSLYCGVMKRKIDGQMRACCMHHHQKSDRSINPSNAMQTIDKPTLSSFELFRSSDVVTFIPFLVDLLAFQEPFGSVDCILHPDHTHSPPDPVIRYLDLRI